MLGSPVGFGSHVGDAARMRMPPVRVLCGLLLFALSALLGSVFWHVEAQDRSLRNHSHHLAQTAVKNFARQTEVLARDYGYWNEAYRNLVEAPDSGWVEENIILDDLHDMLGIDAFLVLDENDVPVLAQVQGSQGRRGPEERMEMPRLLAGGLAELIDHVRSREVSRPYAASAFVNLGDAVALVAVSPILPFQETPRAEVDGKTVHLLVLLRPLTPAYLSEIAHDFGLADLAFVSKRLPRDATLALETKAGTQVASLTWTPSHPGAQPHVLFVVLAAALALGVAGLGYQTVKSWERYCRARQEAERRRQIAAQSSTNFIAHVSQDLRRPLSAMTGLSALVKTEVFASLDKERYRAYLTDVVLAARQLVDTVSTVLDLSSLGKRDYKPIITVVPVAGLLKDVESMMAFRFRRREVALKIEECAADLAVLADPMTLKHIILELITDAIKETPEDGQVTVRTARVGGDWIEIAVADQGDGMAKDRISVMLHPFAGLSPDGARDADLGLAVIQALVKLHGGTLTVMSKPGEGTIILLRLPAASC
ncbi:hypothetical protein HBA54_19520 [Pelagibius litoralis]|uniref:histidine kinase n=1 Tax=Pelagibius litoralis TaxID=374515 RepID=A0A967F0J7_9PROT|nr:ATP-binding protein [Pelagibius litoralis]NIA70793.1 hypothetical protein [Pelagibius litoralis]